MFNKNFWLGVTWFIVVWLGVSRGINFIGDNLPDEYMGDLLTGGLVFLAVRVILAFVINRYKRGFAFGFFGAFTSGIIFLIFSLV